MLASLSLALLLAAAPAVPAEVDAIARAFAEALIRDDIPAAAGTVLPDTKLDSAQGWLETHDRVLIDSYRVASIEPAAESLFLVVEIAGSALVNRTGEREQLPRWWSLEVKDGRLVFAMTRERRLAYESALKSPAELSALLQAHPELDANRFLYHLANAAADAGLAGCDTVLWAEREANARGLAEAECMALQMESHLATLLFAGAAALPPAQRSLTIANAVGSPDLISDSLFSLGIASWFAGRLDQAVDFLSRAAGYAEEVSDPALPMKSAYMAGYLELQQNHLRQALALTELHRRLLERHPSLFGTMTNAFQSGLLHDRLGNAEVARQQHEIAREAARRLGDKSAEAMAVFNLAVDAVDRGLPDARSKLEEAYVFANTNLGAGHLAVVQAALVRVRVGEGDFAGAEQLLAEIWAGVENAGEPTVRAGFYVTRSAFHLAAGRPEEALADARKARELASSDWGKATNSLTDTLVAEGRALRQLSRNGEAEAAWRMAIDLVDLELAERAADENWNAALLARKLEPYRRLLDLLVEQDCAREALAVAERMRARSLRENLRHGRIDLSAGLDETKRARERELESALAEANRALLAASDDEAIAGLRARRDAARLALRRFRSELSIAHPDLDRRRADPLARGEVSEAVAAPGEVVLELAMNEDAVFAFVLRGADVMVHRLPVSQNALETKIGEFVAALEQRDLAYRQPARSLYDLLLGPIAPHLGDAKRLRIVPDGALWRVPFHALIDDRGQPLAERVAVAYSPSLALSRGNAPPLTAPRTLLAFADPVVPTSTASATRSLYRDVTLGRLPEAASEAKAIARLYGDATVRLGPDAHESAFKQESSAFRVLHLAAHGIFDDGAPMFSSIVLASSSANPLDDGLLEAREIADLDLNADLAVLSACETARGAVKPGEGVIGLSWAFLAAGVPTTVVSQWKVGSASTAELMVRFHGNLRGGADVAEALRAAMLDIRRDPRWQHPFYWAPFVVIENGSAR